jgi:hypothetical protein
MSKIEYHKALKRLKMQGLLEKSFAIQLLFFAIPCPSSLDMMEAAVTMCIHVIILADVARILS